MIHRQKEKKKILRKKRNAYERIGSMMDARYVWELGYMSVKETPSGCVLRMLKKYI
jgi:hypothetical protein